MAVVPRHVAYIEAHGLSNPERYRRQRAILDAVAREYRPLPEKPPNQERSKPIEGFAFSTRTTAPEAVARLVGILGSVDPEWRDYVRVWDGWGREDAAQPQLSDPPRRLPSRLPGRVADLLRRVFGR